MGAEQVSSPYFDRELADTLHAAVRGRVQAPVEVRAAVAAAPERFARVRAASAAGAGYLDLDAHAARVVNTLNRMEDR